MAEVTKVLYIVVVDDADESKSSNESFRYTRPILQSALQLMGCKARHAFKISKRVFQLTTAQVSGGGLHPQGVKESGKDEQDPTVTFDLYKRRTTAIRKRQTFLDIVCDAMAEYKYIGPNQRADLILACRIRERKESVTVLLCGTSGCGKSTLSALLGNRLGVTTVVSTDSIRHMMRSFVDEKENPLLWSSTYHAGEFLDPVAVAEAKARSKAKKLTGVCSHSKEDLTESSDKSDTCPSALVPTTTELISSKQMAIKGYKAQSEMVVESLDRLITAWEERKESVVVEGVHLSLNFVMGLMRKHPSIIPFMIYIANEDKHLERFAVRAKYMTLDPAKNKYVKYIRNIRTIQEYLCTSADKHLVPKINNTNVDKSVASIHATVFSCLRRRETGEPLYDPIRNTATIVDEEYKNQCVANSLGSKGMFQLIQNKGSSRHLMALVNTDGSVAKAWPVNSIDSNGKPKLGPGSENEIGNPMYGPLQIGSAEPVNIPFGLYGISAFPTDGGTSNAGSVDDSRADGTDSGTNLSSGCSSPRMSDGPSKELKEEDSVYGSDEEIDESPEPDSDEDLSDNDKEVHDEVGSVDEESTKSDEEYDDLAMQDTEEKGAYCSDDEVPNDKRVPLAPGERAPKTTNQIKRMDLFSEPLSEPLCSYSSLVTEKNETMHSLPGNLKFRKRSLSIPAFRKRTIIGDPILSGAPHR